MPISAFLSPGEKPTSFRTRQPEAWHQALSEFLDLDSNPDVILKVTIRAPDAMMDTAPAIILRATTVTSDAEVELPQKAVDQLELSDQVAQVGEVTYSYLLSSVLAGCLRAAKESKAVKVRFNQSGVMSNQFILRGRGQQLYCEAMVCPIAPMPQSEQAAPGAAAASSQGLGAVSVSQRIGSAGGYPANGTIPGVSSTIGASIGNPYASQAAAPADTSIGY
eukprot:TRINITY_DN25076_c0_g1_i3.p1 TRINITY_DN25076_c0_g1~~TRINITY_DN25076_c0_g1_i3.p1  ORF type:complete len:221 (-),score=29.30 TRINITY_DN25076_c0_g1_i3:99-761(-)